MDWIENNLLTIVGILITVIGGTFAFFWEYRNERRKISYDIITDTELIDDKLKENYIKILYADSVLSNLRLLVFRVVNDGFKPIRKDEFDSSINLQFGDNARILAVELLKIVPDNLPLELVQEHNAVNIEPLLLNRGDSFTLKLLVTDSDNSNPVPKVRISGINDFTIYKKSAFISYCFNIAGMFAFVGFITLFVETGNYIEGQLQNNPNVDVSINKMFFSVGMIIIGYFFLRLRNYLLKTSI